MPDVEAICDIRNRAWQATREGRFIDALRIYEEELTPLQEPKTLGNLNNLAVLHLSMGNYDKAMAVFVAARNLPFPPATPVPFVGAVLWMQGHHEVACEDWAYEIERRRLGAITHCDEAGGVQVPALLWWASAHPGLQSWRKLADQELKKRGRTKRCQNSRWPGPLVPFLTEQAVQPAPSDKALLDKALLYSSAYPALNSRRVCLAHFYAGAADLARGNVFEYEVHLRRVLAAEANDLAANALPTLDAGGALRLHDPEYHLARAELQGIRT